MFEKLGAMSSSKKLGAMTRAISRHSGALGRPRRGSGCVYVVECCEKYAPLAARLRPRLLWVMRAFLGGVKIETYERGAVPELTNTSSS